MEEEMDFNAEIKEFIDQEFIKEFQIIEEISAEKAKCLIISLEDNKIIFYWSKKQGIQIISINEEAKTVSFEGIEALLDTFSPAYQTKFHSSLFAKLAKLQ